MAVNGSDHYDALETRDPEQREMDLFARLPDVLRRAIAAPGYAERLRGVDPGISDQPPGAGSFACAAKIGTACTAQVRSAIRGLDRDPIGFVWAAVYFPGSYFRTRARPCRPVARRPGAIRGRLPSRRCRAQHVQLSPDARRVHLRCFRAGAWLRSDSGRSRQHGRSVSADRSVPSDRL